MYKLVDLLEQAVRVGEPLVTDTLEDETDPGETFSPDNDGSREKILRDRREAILEEARRERDAILTQARQEAEILVKAACEECESLHETAREGGRETGVHEGREWVKQEWERKVALFEQWFQTIRKSREELLETIREPLMDLCVFIAEKIIQREAERDPFIMHMIKRALEKLSHRERVVVRVNPMEYVLVRELKDDLLARVDGIDFLEIREDNRIEAGGCLVETLYGTVDARIKDQLDIIREILREAIRII
ncbi:MAG TPA: FliH/SctL family protein [Atribacteraceae bacterium]|nr:FliH/SctL family protein [Atribacteraceae bacterium]